MQNLIHTFVIAFSHSHELDNDVECIMDEISRQAAALFSTRITPVHVIFAEKEPHQEVDFKVHLRKTTHDKYRIWIVPLSHSQSRITPGDGETVTGTEFRPIESIIQSDYKFLQEDCSQKELANFLLRFLEKRTSLATVIYSEALQPHGREAHFFRDNLEGPQYPQARSDE